ncbi:MAG: adenylyltransferase/cytidyltransferase family protein [Actinomycetaceae bacterium]|nr:adenylyltransferase/cytidyltransferase family protein [Actinomycetaceae bacterium]
MTTGHATDGGDGLIPAPSRIVGYVPGGFDMLHIGHLNVLRAARKHCDRLVVGVATDESLERMKGRPPVIPLRERCELIASLRFVDAVVVDLDQDKRLAWRLQPFDILFKGDDWQGTEKGARLEEELAEVGARVFYLPYTPSTSSTMLRSFLTPKDVAQELGPEAVDKDQPGAHSAEATK